MERAIEKMVEWLENRKVETIEGEYEQGADRAFEICGDKARRLAADEAKEKATAPAPASLYADLEDLYNKSLYRHDIALKVIGAFDVKDLLLKYRPTPSGDEGLMEILSDDPEKCCPRYNECPVPCGKYDPYCPNLRPSPKPSESELVRELREWKAQKMDPKSPAYYEHLVVWYRQHDEEFNEILSRHDKGPK